MTRRRPTAAVVATLSVAALAAAVILIRLGAPETIVFDEIYYVGDARGMLTDGVAPGFAVHPPLGKWVVAAGIAVLGDTPTGWRIGGALLAVLAVGLTVAIGRRLTGRIWAGVVAGVLLALDGVWLVQARTAMLDATLAAAVVVGAYLLMVDHQRSTARASDPLPADDGTPTGIIHTPRYSRWPLVAAGVAFGVAAAAKWSGLFALAAAVLLAAGWELAARRRRGRLDAAEVLRAAVPVAVALVAVPAAVYLAAFTPWLVNYPATTTAAADCPGVADCNPDVGTRLAGLGRYHAEIADFHLDLDAAHPYRAPATTWPTLARPVVYFYETCDQDGRNADDRPCVSATPGRSSEVVGLGNPALWWSSLLLIPVAAGGLRRRDGAAAVPLVFLGAQFLPWLMAARPVFSFYTVPLVPFLSLAVAVACVELERPGRRRTTTAAAVAAGGPSALVVLAVGAPLPTVATVALLAATTGAAVGGVLDGRREVRRGVPVGTGHVGIVTATVVVGAAVALFGYFSPVWYAWPLPDELLRMRWWFSSWV